MSDTTAKAIDHTQELKQFDKADLIKTLAAILNQRDDLAFTKAVINDLQFVKHKRLIDILKRKQKEYIKKYKRYENKSIPRKLQPSYGKFILSFTKIEDELKAHIEIMKSRGLIKKEQ